jgi:hypothetical protein
VGRGGGGGRPRGSTLVAVLAIVAAVLLIGVAIFILGHSEGDVVEYTVDDARAFYLAEGGLERMRAWLGDFHADQPLGDPVGKTFQTQMLGGGTYTVEVADVVNPELPVAYAVVSTGDMDSVLRQVRATMLEETFAAYQVFVERGGWIWFRTGERFEGPVHVNHALQVDGDPWFGARVTAGGGYTEKAGSNPVFEEGYELNADVIPLPADSYVTDVLLPAAQSGGGLVLPPLNGNQAKYVVELGVPSAGWMRYCSYEKVGTGYVTSDWTSVDLAAISNGVLYSPEPLRLSGTLDGRITIGVEGNIEISGDVLYEGSTPGGGIDADCDDVLGLIANGDVVVASTPDNQNDCEIHAAMMALEKNIEAEDYQQGDPRGEIEIHGALIADYSIHLGQYKSGVLISGYSRDYHWDPRLTSSPPPFFPTTGRFLIYSWEEVVPPEV